METITKRIGRIAELASKHRNLNPPVPKSVKIELTARCDLQCFFCAAQTRLRARSDMPREFYARIVKELRDLGVEELGVFYLGESFLCDWLADSIRYAKRVCGYPYVFLTTNGRLATAERVRSCMLAGLDSLKFSFNFCGPKQFTDSTGASAAGYRTVVNNIQDARWIRDYVADTTGHRCGIYASSLIYDDEQRERMQDAVDKILPYVDEHYWLPFYGRARLPDCAGGGMPVAGGVGRSGAARKQLPCWGLFTEGHITYDGQLSACGLDHNSRFHMGDLHHVSFRDAWHSPAFQALRAAHLKGEVSNTACERCIGYD